LPVSNRFEIGFSIGKLSPLRGQEPEFGYKVTYFLWYSQYYNHRIFTDLAIFQNPAVSMVLANRCQVSSRIYIRATARAYYNHRKIHHLNLIASRR